MMNMGKRMHEFQLLNNVNNNSVLKAEEETKKGPALGLFWRALDLAGLLAACCLGFGLFWAKLHGPQKWVQNLHGP